jgi:NAD(P)-dependent dehydrogenase (short-subunit alcohol dehydrogenase family)
MGRGGKGFALITGASSGIGAIYAERLPKRAARVPIKGCRMRNGWAYSLFAGVIALPIAAWVVRSFVTHDLTMMSQVVAAMMFAAIAAARVGGWLARLVGGREYGLRAAIFTGLVYLIFSGVLGVLLEQWPHLSHAAAERLDPLILATADSWTIYLREGQLAFAEWFAAQTFGFVFVILLFFAWWTIVPACIIGTLLFTGFSDSPLPIRLAIRSDRT